MIEKRFGKDFDSAGGALTLSPDDVTETQDSGWVINGRILEDYYEWVNSFEAIHPELGRVYGDFEGVVYATSEEAFSHFYSNHPQTAWDYYDI